MVGLDSRAHLPRLQALRPGGPPPAWPLHDHEDIRLAPPGDTVRASLRHRRRTAAR